VRGVPWGRGEWSKKLRDAYQISTGRRQMPKRFRWRACMKPGEWRLFVRDTVRYNNLLDGMEAGDVLQMMEEDESAAEEEGE
jgi:hypothetical protein